MSPKEMASLTKDQKTKGVPKDWKAMKECFVPFEKGGESDSVGGWLPNYHVPTGFFINWAEDSIKDMRKNAGFAWKNEQFFFKPGLTFSISGAYAPTFRLNSAGVFEAKGSGIFTDKIEPEVLLGILCSTFARYQFKTYIKHTVDTSGDDIREFRLPEMEAGKLTHIKTLVQSIIAKQKVDPRYRYDQNEQLEIDCLVYELYDLDENDIREVELWFARRYDKLALAQGVTSRVQSDYTAHLERARILRDKPYRYWSSHPWLREISRGEGPNIEFKQQFAHAEKKTLEAVASLLNADGGVLFIGVTDAGDPVGLDVYDLKQPATPNADKLELAIRNTLSGKLGLSPLAPLVSVALEPVGGVTLARVEVKPSREPVYIDKTILVVRDGNQKHTLTGPAATKWILERAARYSG